LHKVFIGDRAKQHAIYCLARHASQRNCWLCYASLLACGTANLKKIVGLLPSVANLKEIVALPSVAQQTKEAANKFLRKTQQRLDCRVINDVGYRKV
jgi:hypothetical protein